MGIVDDFASIGARMREFTDEPSHGDEPVCDVCEGGGHEMYGTGHNDPHFRECSKCGNPKGLPCP